MTQVVWNFACQKCLMMVSDAEFISRHIANLCTPEGKQSMQEYKRLRKLDDLQRL